jgi:hypothetical protein
MEKEILNYTWKRESNMSDKKHIPGKHAVPPEDKILSYLKKNMPDEEQHDFEKNTSEDEFMNDAMEGLESLHPQTNISHVARQLNADLKSQLNKKKKRKEKRKYKEQPWVYFAVILVLLLLLAAFIVMKQFV